MLLTVTELANFVLRFRNGKCLKNYAPVDIENLIGTGIESGCVFVDCAESGRVLSILVGKPHAELRNLHIQLVLSIKQDSRRKIAAWLLQNFRDWSVSANRRGRFIEYKNPEEAMRKFLML